MTIYLFCGLPIQQKLSSLMDGFTTYSHQNSFQPSLPMKTMVRLFLVPFCLLVILTSCALQDHLKPASDPYKNCLITQIRNIQKIKMEPGSKLKVGDPFLDYLPEAGKITEIIEVDGQKYALGPLSDLIDQFKYDSQKRVTEHVHILTTAKGAEVFSYEYPSPNQLTQKYVHEGFPTQSRTTTYQLDSGGLIDRNKEILVSGDYFGHYSYGSDPANNPVYTTNPLVVEGTNPTTGKFTSRTEFDLTKPNLPNPVPFFGKTDLNLHLKTTTTYETNIPKVVELEHRYVYDSQGKVIRRITINTYDSDKGVTVTDYEYQCQ